MQGEAAVSPVGEAASSVRSGGAPAVSERGGAGSGSPRAPAQPRNAVAYGSSIIACREGAEWGLALELLDMMQQDHRSACAGCGVQGLRRDRSHVGCFSPHPTPEHFPTR